MIPKIPETLITKHIQVYILLISVCCEKATPLGHVNDCVHFGHHTARQKGGVRLQKGVPWIPSLAACEDACAGHQGSVTHARLHQGLAFSFSVKQKLPVQVKSYN